MISAVSNEMSRLLPPERLGSGMGLFQMMQFFAGAFGIALSGTAIAWQHGLSAGRTFNNILWGIVGLSLLGIVSSVIYLRMLRQMRAVEPNP
jgi:MFS transporter, DHA2 family, metal-tetracycline-proton antiporter